MSDIFEEVEEGLRQDRAAELWKRFAPFIWGLLAVAVIIVGVREMYLLPAAEKTRQANAEALETAHAAFVAGEYEKASNAFQTLAETGGPLSALASNYLAAVKLECFGDREAALEALSRGAASSEDPFADLALLKAAYAQADEETLEGLEIRLDRLVEKESAFGALARELIAMKAFSTGDTARAREMFNYLRFDAHAPSGVQQRAERALAVIPNQAEIEPAPVDPETADGAEPEPAIETPE